MYKYLLIIIIIIYIIMQTYQKQKSVVVISIFRYNFSKLLIAIVGSVFHPLKVNRMGPGYLIVESKMTPRNSSATLLTPHKK